VTTTLLAVDDSVTMRKVLEITFAGEDFRVVTAESPDAALKKAKNEKPTVALLDVTLPGQDGYTFCKTLKAENPGLLVLILSSKQGPYDAGKGSAAGADDFIDKPFDTQQLIEKVKKVVLSKGAPKADAPVAPAPAPKAGGTLPGSTPATTGSTRTGVAPAPNPPAGTPAVPTRTQIGIPPLDKAPEKPNDKPTDRPAPTGTGTSPGVSRATASFGTPSARSTTTPLGSAPQQKPTQPAMPSVVAPAPQARPTPQTSAAEPAPAAQPSSPLSAAVTSQLNDKIAGLGLTPAQAEAVLALSREVVERVVWEVVPILAETIIKEEIKRLTEEG
jgi:CheY-like chemotaxis protein